MAGNGPDTRRGGWQAAGNGVTALILGGAGIGRWGDNPDTMRGGM